MPEVGQRVVVNVDGRPGGGKAGFVIGHVGNQAIVSLDENPGENVLVPDSMASTRRGSQPRPLLLMPSGRTLPLTREGQKRFRTRRPIRAVQVQGPTRLHAREAPEDR